MIRLGWASATLAVGLSAGVPARAEQGFALNRFQPADDPGGFFAVASPAVVGDQRLSAGLTADYAHAPLVLRTADGDRRGDVVAGQLYLHATFAYAFRERLLVSLAIPFAASNSGQDVVPPDGPAIPAPSGAALGDVSLGARVRLLGDARLALGLGTRVWLPSGKPGAYTGDGSVRGAVDLVVGGQLASAFLWSVSTAVALRKRRELHGLVSDDEVQVAGALAYRLARDRLLLGPEVVASLIPQGGGGLGDRGGLAQVLLSARYRPGPLFVGLSAGPGLGRASGSPAVRLLASVGYAPRAAPVAPPPTSTISFARPAFAQPPVAPVQAAPASPLPADRDGDGIADLDDGCPREQGPRTSEPKTSGCPSLVRVTEQQIVTLKKVHFVSGVARLHPDASELLEQVAQVLKEHPEIRRIAIDGHTDGRGGARRNLELSTARARAVRQWLMDHGVAAERLEARGFGPSRRLAPDDTEDGRERNRRVEFRIVDPAPLDVSATEPGGGP